MPLNQMRTPLPVHPGRDPDLVRRIRVDALEELKQKYLRDYVEDPQDGTEVQKDAERLLKALEWRDQEGESIQMALRKHGIGLPMLAGIARAALQSTNSQKQAARDTLLREALRLIGGNDE